MATPPPSAPPPPPPVLPVTTSAQQQAHPIANPAFRTFLNRLTETVRSSLANRRPWGELADRNAFAKPESLTEASLRIRKNYAYFRTNYISLIALILAISLLTNPFSLILLLALLAAWLFLYLFRTSSDTPLTLFGRTFSERETLGILVLLTTGVIFLTSVGSVLMSAVLVGFSLVCAHGAVRVPDDLFLDEQQDSAAAGGGMLSLLGGAATNAAASIHVARV